MNSLWRRIIVPSTFRPILKQEFRQRFISNFVCKNVNITSNLVQLPANYNPIRFKSKKHDTGHDSDDDDDKGQFLDDSSLARDSKVVKFSTTSMRTDIILKSALGVARNKIEQVFYESKIRLNGRKVLKKSASVKIGDEIDVIKSISPKNPDHIIVSRVEILDVTPKDDSISVTTRRFKSLLIENYETDPFKSSVAETET